MKILEHGPAKAGREIPVADCPSCGGRGLIRGVFHQLECIGCHATGMVHAETLEAIPLEVLVVLLGTMLRKARNVVTGPSVPAGAEAHYNENNRRGAGGSNFTGD
ncbi:hypothetical protein C4E44_01625 [Pseudomonas sp. MWU12-2312b]|nr:hypothetical protein C4E44_01625 [Pseudomonas sp. MWU12-2312b]